MIATNIHKIILEVIRKVRKFEKSNGGSVAHNHDRHFLDLMTKEVKTMEYALKV
jgi:hypothetical protein